MTRHRENWPFAASYEEVGKWVASILHIEGARIKVRAQNMHKNSRAARLLQERGLPAATVLWAWVMNKNHPQYVGVFISKTISPDDVIAGPFEPVSSNNDYIFYKLT